MGKKITVDLSEKAWLILMEKQFEGKKKGEKLSLSQMVAEMVDEKLGTKKKPTE